MNFTKLPHRLNHRFITLFLSLIVPCSVFAQAQRERTLEEIKTEAIKRAENGMYPLIGLDPADVREAFSAIKTTDNDEWAAAFSVVADRYMAQAKALEATDPAKASATYVRAWRLYSFGRWPALPRRENSARMPERSKRFSRMPASLTRSSKVVA